MSQSAFVRPSAPAASIRRDSDARRSSNWRAWLIGRPLNRRTRRRRSEKPSGLRPSSPGTTCRRRPPDPGDPDRPRDGRGGGAGLDAGLGRRVTAGEPADDLQQTIHAYPWGAALYIVARDNLGEFAAQVQALALFIDCLTVSVSVGFGNWYGSPPRLRRSTTTSLYFGALSSGLRDIHEVVRRRPVGARLRAADLLLRGDDVPGPSASHSFRPLHRVLVRRSAAARGSPTRCSCSTSPSSSGTTAVTGVQAISNGIPAFEQQRSRNAGITLLWMAGILGTLFLAISYLAVPIGAIPSERKTVIWRLRRPSTVAASCTSRRSSRRSSVCW